MNRSAQHAKRALVAAPAAFLVLFLLVSLAFAWGATAHQLVTHSAVAVLPSPLKGFFDSNMESLIAFSNEPDLLSQTDASEGPNHFFDLDALDEPPFADITTDKAALLERFGPTALDHGRLPWAVADRYDLLVEAFRVRDLQAILRHAGYLSHYVSDATMPLHATKNYKGQFSGNVIFPGDSIHRHVHVRFEIAMVDAFQSRIESAMKSSIPKPENIDDPAAFTLDLLKDSYTHVDEILAADRDLLKPSGQVTSQYYAALYKRLGPLAVRRLRKASDAVASLWTSAWRDAGKPLFVRAEVVLTTPLLECTSPQATEDKIEKGTQK